MNIEPILFGIFGLILLVFSITNFLCSFYLSKREKPTFRFYTIMTLLAILGGLSLSYPITMGFATHNSLDKSSKKISKDKVISTQSTESTKANAKERLFLPTAYNTIETTHPSVVNFPQKWNGYKYWMAVTPYPKGDATKENPHLLVSNNLVEWHEPISGINPLDEVTHERKEDISKQYNSDTHLIFNQEENRLEMFWRYVDDVNKLVHIYRIDSTDGINWSEKQSVHSAPRKTSDWVSPAFIKDETGYKVWYIAGGYRLKYRESQDGFNWTEEEDLPVNYDTNSPKDMRHWHIDVQKIDNRYEMIAVGFKQVSKQTLESRHTMSLYHSYSNDGKNWETLKPIIHPSKKKDAWDGKGLYRSCFIKENNKYYVFYSGIGFDATRGIGLSYGEDIYNLTGSDFSHTEKLTQ